MQENYLTTVKIIFPKIFTKYKYFSGKSPRPAGFSIYRDLVLILRRCSRWVTDLEHDLLTVNLAGQDQICQHFRYDVWSQIFSWLRLKSVACHLSESETREFTTQHHLATEILQTLSSRNTTYASWPTRQARCQLLTSRHHQIFFSFRHRINFVIIFWNILS